MNKQPKETMEENWARNFHNTYERLAPKFGYETREDTKVFDPESKNGKLMIAVCLEVINKELELQREEIIQIVKTAKDPFMFPNTEKRFIKTIKQQWVDEKPVSPDAGGEQS